MIVIAMIGILSAIAVPRFNAWLPGYRLKSAVSDLQSNMQKARVMAIKGNLSVQIRFDNTNLPGFYYFDTIDDDAYTAGEFRVNLSSYSSGVDYGTGNASLNWSGNNCTQATAIGFGSRGTANQASVFLQNENAAVCYAVTTSIAGTAKVRKYNGLLPFSTNNWIQ
jgi:Tfp pilus assembly protein FimT